MATSFGALMEYAWRQTPEFTSATALLPVPLHRRSENVRGYNQAALLAQSLALRTHVPVRSDILLRHRRTAQQIRLEKEARRRNMTNAFSLHAAVKGLQGEKIVLIDDVGTTGSTLAECAIALRRAGAAWVGALVLSRDL